MKSNLKSVDVLPVLNLTDSFIITKEAKETLKVDWLGYIDLVQDMAFAEKSKFEIVKKIAKERKPYAEMGPDARRIFGFEGKLKVVNHMSKQNNYETRPGMAYSSLVDLFYDANTKDSSGMNLKSIIDRFFAYQWSQGKLLYPLLKKSSSSRKASSWDDFIKKSPIFRLLDKAYTSLQKAQPGSRISKNPFYNLLSSTSWTTTDSIEEKDLQDIYIYFSDISAKKKINVDNSKRVLNEIRRILVEEGRKDICTPSEAVAERKGGYHDIEKIKATSFIDGKNVFIDDQKMAKHAQAHLVTLCDDGLGVMSARRVVVAIRMFFKYLSINYMVASIDVKAVDAMFDPAIGSTLFSYLQERQGSKEGAIIQLNMIIPFLVSCELYSSQAKKIRLELEKRLRLYLIGLQCQEIWYCISLI